MQKITNENTNLTKTVKDNHSVLKYQRSKISYDV